MEIVMAIINSKVSMTHSRHSLGVGMNMSPRVSLASLVACVGLAASSASAQYSEGFVWNRLADWTPRPPSDAGTSNGNPDDDSTGRPCWEYRYTVNDPNAGGLGSSVPWYTVATNKSVWDQNWFGNGTGVWARGNDLNPPIGQGSLTHTFGSGNGPYVPVILWRYPGSCPVRVSFYGELTLVWSGLDAQQNTGPIDVIVARRAASGALTLVFSDTYARPTNPPSDNLTIPVNVDGVAIAPGDVVLVSCRSRIWLGSNWSNMLDDGLSIQVTRSPALVDQPPTDTSTCPTGAVSFAVSPLGAGPFDYQWQVNDPVSGWTDLSDGALYIAGSLTCGTINGASLANMQVSLDCEATPQELSGAEFRCVVSSSCGTETSDSATLTICPGDLNCDGFVNGDDYDAFASAFEAGDLAADFNHDGFVNGDDYDSFASAFEAGC
jgi:hypothetical protein